MRPYARGRCTASARDATRTFPRRCCESSTSRASASGPRRRSVRCCRRSAAARSTTRFRRSRRSSSNRSASWAAARHTSRPSRAASRASALPPHSCCWTAVRAHGMPRCAKPAGSPRGAPAMRDDPRAGREAFEPAALSARDRDAALALIQRLHGVIKSLKLYDPGHAALRTQLEELLKVVREMERDEVSLLGVGGYCYVNGVRLRPEAAHLSIVRGVLEELELRHVGGLRFSPTLSAGTPPAFPRALHAETPGRATVRAEPKQATNARAPAPRPLPPPRPPGGPPLRPAAPGGAGGGGGRRR